jgi:hypothetical protein
MPLKRSTPSFTVEYRQTKRRLHSGGAKLGSGQENLPPIGLNEMTYRVAISAFKTASAKQPGEVVENSIPAGRVLPSLVEADPVTGQSSRGRPNNMVEPRDAENPGDGGPKSTSYGGARQVEHITPARTSETAARSRDNRIHAAEGLEPRLAAAGTLVPKQPGTPRVGVGELATPKSKKRMGHPPEWRKNLDDAPVGSSRRSDIALTNSASDVPAVSGPSSSIRKGRILGRYVFRDDLGPGDSWKRRIETRRERRG